MGNTERVVRVPALTIEDGVVNRRFRQLAISMVSKTNQEDDLFDLASLGQWLLTGDLCSRSAWKVETGFR